MYYSTTKLVLTTNQHEFTLMLRVVWNKVDLRLTIEY